MKIEISLLLVEALSAQHRFLILLRVSLSLWAQWVFLLRLLRSSFHLYPVHGWDADVFRAGELWFRTLPAGLPVARPAELLHPHRLLHHRLLHTAGGVLQVRHTPFLVHFTYSHWIYVPYSDSFLLRIYIKCNNIVTGKQVLSEKVLTAVWTDSDIYGLSSFSANLASSFLLLTFYFI